MTKTVILSRTKPNIRADQALLHWQRPGCTLKLDASVAGQEAAALLASTMVDAMDAGLVDEMVAYDAVFATEDPWMLRLWSYDREEGRYSARWTKLSLRLSKATVSATLDTFAGVPMLWNHFSWGSPAVGRVAKMKATGGVLSGSVMLSALALAGYGTTLEQIDVGMNAGLSVGLHLYDEPKLKRADGDGAGTFDKPDDLTYGRVRITEASLTATPMIAQAGLKGRTEGSEA